MADACMPRFVDSSATQYSLLLLYIYVTSQGGFSFNRSRTCVQVNGWLVGRLQMHNTRAVEGQVTWVPGCHTPAANTVTKRPSHLMDSVTPASTSSEERVRISLFHVYHSITFQHSAALCHSA